MQKRQARGIRDKGSDPNRKRGDRQRIHSGKKGLPKAEGRQKTMKKRELETGKELGKKKDRAGAPGAPRKGRKKITLGKKKRSSSRNMGGIEKCMKKKHDVVLTGGMGKKKIRWESKKKTKTRKDENRGVRKKV